LKQSVKEALNEILDGKNILWQEPMSAHTTFHVGGPADCFVTPVTEQEVSAVLRLFSNEKEPFFILGNGSNLLVSDQGYRGTIIQFAGNYNEITIKGDRIIAQAGALLSEIAQRAYGQGLTGIEFASGIPGTLGGAAVMNAGAYDGEMKQVIEAVRLFDLQSGSIICKGNEEMKFGYRRSLLKEQPMLALEVTLKLQGGDPIKIKERMEELKASRAAKQPLEYPSAGSTFKRPEGYFAGKLIHDTGLQGYRVGGAMISEKHSGFVINAGDATAADVLALIRSVREKVYERFHVLLEPEVCMLGEDMTV